MQLSFFCSSSGGRGVHGILCRIETTSSQRLPHPRWPQLRNSMPILTSTFAAVGIVSRLPAYGHWNYRNHASESRRCSWRCQRMLLLFRKQPDSARDLAHFRPQSRPHASTITRPPTDDKDLNGAPDIYAFEPKAPALSPALPLVVVCSTHSLTHSH